MIYTYKSDSVLGLLLRNVILIEMIMLYISYRLCISIILKQICVQSSTLLTTYI